MPASVQQEQAKLRAAAAEAAAAAEDARTEADWLRARLAGSCAREEVDALCDEVRTKPTRARNDTRSPPPAAPPCGGARPTRGTRRVAGVCVSAAGGLPPPPFPVLTGQVSSFTSY